MTRKRLLSICFSLPVDPVCLVWLWSGCENRYQLSNKFYALVVTNWRFRFIFIFEWTRYAHVCWYLWQIGKAAMTWLSIISTPIQLMFLCWKKSSMMNFLLQQQIICVPQQTQPIIYYWIRPPIDFLKINTDGDFSNISICSYCYFMWTWFWLF